MALFGGNSSGEGPNPNVRLVIGMAVSAYLIYLGGKLIADNLHGEAGVSIAFSWGFGLFFILAGAGYLLFQYRTYKSNQEKQNREDAGGTNDAAPEETWTEVGEGGDAGGLPEEAGDYAEPEEELPDEAGDFEEPEEERSDEPEEEKPSE